MTAIAVESSRRKSTERAASCPSSPTKPVCLPPEPIRTFPRRAVSHGGAEAVPVRLQTSAGLVRLFTDLATDREKLAVVLDFDKVITSERLEQPTQPAQRVRGGLAAVNLLRQLHSDGVPLFIATARREEKLPDLVRQLAAVASLGYLDYFSDSTVHPGQASLCQPKDDRHRSDSRAVNGTAVARSVRTSSPNARCSAVNWAERPTARAHAHNPSYGTWPESPRAAIEVVYNEELDIRIRKVRGLRIFSSGYEKGKLVAHIAARELPPSRSTIVFIDDNVFNAHFVLQEAPEYLDLQQPGRRVSIISSWWDPSQEQSSGEMRIATDSDFSFAKDYSPCLSTFGVDEKERVRTAGILAAKALLRDEQSLGLRGEESLER
mmetsp:Transcript_3726/g.11594  ORF Transcript_3726/g.11594 Transcript_3726/m.11594 type:complete len:378 (-) Transcript_3726:639-1772(-)